jgi:OmpA-OmpF porin, OOP family
MSTLTRFFSLGGVVFAGVFSLLIALPGSNAQAQSVDKSGYLQSSGGVVRSGFGLCWRTGYWTPQMAIEECDPDLVPKKPVAAAPVPPPAPAPAPVAPPPPPPAPAPAPAAAAPAPTPAPAPVPAVVPAAPEAPPKPMVEKVSLKADALFDFDKSIVKPEGRAALDRLADQAKALELEVIIAVGHTDWTGTEKYNQSLSERRASAVKAYLITKGIAENRIYTEGKGESQPVASNKTREGRAQNRRVEVEVVGTRPVR